MIKKSQHLVSPECASLTTLPAIELDSDNLAFFRGLRPLGLKPPVALKELRYTTKTALRADASELEIFMAEPLAAATRPRPVILFVHGGGMISGNADQFVYELPDYIEQFDFVVASVEYRLAPEAQFPDQQDDLLTGYQWLIENASELNIDSDNIVLMGISAGGGLAASFAQMLRDKGLPQASAQILVYPMLDHRTGTENCLYKNPYAGEFVWSKQNNHFAWQSLQGSYQANDERKGWFSPALANNLANLPPAFVACGALDLFVDETLNYGRELIKAGVPTEIHVYPGAVHGFNIMEGSSLAEQYREDLQRFFSRQFTNSKTL